MEWLKPLMTAGHWVPEMVASAGGQAGLAEAGKPSAYVAWDAIRAYQPDLILFMPCGLSVSRTRQEVELVTGLEGWAALPAVANGRVFIVDGNAYFNRSGPRLVDGVEMLAGLIHPELGPWPPIPEGAVLPLCPA